MLDRSLLPPPRTFYERELGQLRRPSRGWATPKAGCPFHDSKSKTSFRVNVDSGGFVCFGCGAKGGDVIAFVMLRYRVNFKAAAEQLHAWRGNMSQSERLEIRRSAEEAEHRRAVESARSELVRRKIRSIRDEILRCNTSERELSGRLSALGGPHASGPEADDLWHCLQLTWELREFTDREYLRACGLEDGR